MDHFYESVDGWFGEPDKRAYDRAVAKYSNDDIFVEIGSFKGRSSSIMAVNIINSKKDIKFYCVDTWMGSEEHQEGGAYEDKDVVSNTLFETFLKNISPVSDYITPIKKPSLEAVNEFQDKSLSFVFIDASHKYEDVKSDMNAWHPKIKSGGILSGHDWTWGSVKRAVEEFAFENKLNIYVDADIWEIYI